MNRTISLYIRIEPKPSTTALTLCDVKDRHNVDTRAVAAMVIDQFLAEEASILIDDVEKQIATALKNMTDDHKT